MSRSFLYQVVSRLFALLVLFLLFFSALTFVPSAPHHNSLGFLGHTMGFSLRFLFGLLCYPLLLHAAASQIKELRRCFLQQAAPPLHDETTTLQTLYPYVYACALLSAGFLLAHIAYYFPHPMSVLRPLSLSSGQNPAYAISGQLIAALYRELSFPNLQALLGPTGFPMIFTFFFALSIWILSLVHKEEAKLRPQEPSLLRKMVHALFSSKKKSPLQQGIDPDCLTLESSEPGEMLETHSLDAPLLRSAFPNQELPTPPLSPLSSHASAQSLPLESLLPSFQEGTNATTNALAHAANRASPQALRPSISPPTLPSQRVVARKKISPPSKQLLTAPTPVDMQKTKQQLQELTSRLEETLESFGIEARVGKVHVGPRVLSFEVHPPVGVKVQRIKALENDIALNLQAKSIRIIAPIPGKAAVGIEIPSPSSQEVNFRQMVSAYQRGGKKHAIPVILGKTVSGEDITFDLAKMPHMIIAGATGSGKSVCVNTIIMSVLMHSTPEEIKLLMIDPKKVELTPYTRLPHMLAPVITEPQHAADSLKWLVKEMEKRYEILKILGLRHIGAFNERTPKLQYEAQQSVPIPAKMPYIVGIVDELADLMMTSPADIETPIARIAQMARAVGIHLILATQRPSREVITGLIKANFPARIAFKVASKINSQIILDETGAESLLGNGDMLFLHPAKGVTCRAQGVFVRDEDIEKVLTHLQMQQAPNYWFDPEQIHGELQELEGGEEEDELYAQAREIVIETQTASTTFLQRKLRVGYARAASLMDALHERGVVSGSEGGRARKVLVGAAGASSE